MTSLKLDAPLTAIIPAILSSLSFFSPYISMAEQEDLIVVGGKQRW